MRNNSTFSSLCVDRTVDSLAIICKWLTAVSLQSCQIFDVETARVLVRGINDFHNAEYILAQRANVSLTHRIHPCNKSNRIQDLSPTA